MEILRFILKIIECKKEEKNRIYEGYNRREHQRSMGGLSKVIAEERLKIASVENFLKCVNIKPQIRLSWNTKQNKHKKI